MITYFTAAAGGSTLSVRIDSMVKRGVTPDVNARCARALVFTSVMTMLSKWVLAPGRRSGSSSPMQVIGR